MQSRRQLIAALFAAATLLASPPSSAQKVYAFGVVPQFEAGRLAATWMPILAELKRRTGLEFRMQGSPRIPDFEVKFQAGEFDFAYMNPYHAIVAESRAGYIPLVRDHGRSLFGILLVKKQSVYQTVEDLAGQTIAFPAPNALGASLLMRADLSTRIGIKFTPLYAQTHTSSYMNVLLGRTAAAGGVMGTLKRQKKVVKDGLRTIYTTRKMPPHPVVAHPRVGAQIRAQVRQAFIAMQANPQSAALLARVPIKRIGKASAEDYSPLRLWGLEKFYVTNNP